jgi:hypothetical protein
LGILRRDYYGMLRLKRLPLRDNVATYFYWRLIRKERKIAHSLQSYIRFLKKIENITYIVYGCSKSLSDFVMIAISEEISKGLTVDTTESR